MTRKRSYAVFIIQLIGADQSLHVRSLKGLSFGDSEWSMWRWDSEALITRWLGRDDIYHHIYRDDDGRWWWNRDKVGWLCVCVPALSSHLLGVAHLAHRPHRLVHHSAATSTSKASIFRERCSVLAAHCYNSDLNKLCSRMSSACSVLCSASPGGTMWVKATCCSWQRSRTSPIPGTFTSNAPKLSQCQHHYRQSMLICHIQIGMTQNFLMVKAKKYL